VPALPAYLGPYPSAHALVDAFGELAGARVAEAGRSVLGRPLHRIELGQPEAPAVLLTALMHGVEWIGAVALLECLRALTAPSAAAERVLARSKIVVVPVVNPDALFAISARLARGLPAWQRGNARGVDLNRNFPVQPVATPWHPCAGSRRPLSPYYMGPAPLSEPESRAVHEVAAEVRPFLSLAFHSFGEMLLYPYACSRDPHPRAGEYARLGEALNGAMPARPYVVKPSSHLYPVQGDLDDHLDAQHGALAMTVEVSALSLRLAHPRRLLNPFCWMNPTAVAETVRPLARGILALLDAATTPAVVPASAPPRERRPFVPDLRAAK
jgi:carboxypeptidase T